MVYNGILRCTVWCTVTPGTNVETARQLLIDSGLPITPTGDLSDAARKAVDSIQ